MSLIYRLVGYDRATDALVVEYAIPAAYVEQTKMMAGLAGRPEIIGDWPLSEQQAQKIANFIGKEAAIERYDWFLEPSAAPVDALRPPAA